MDSIPQYKEIRYQTGCIDSIQHFCCIQETHLRDKDRQYLRVKGWEKNFQANSPKKQAGVAILILNKVNFNQKLSKKIKKDTFYSLSGKSVRKKSQSLTYMLQIKKHPHS